MRVEQLTANLEAVRIGMRLINAPHDGSFNEIERLLQRKALFTLDRDAFHPDYMALALHFGARGDD
ncbi:MULTISPECIES: hypothetical protein [unclassified Pseudomonas]|uniref:hypothetical protein n=1 Tax=unclassified Pseudomonas TaxID=196821 RepID=UPI0002722F0D|nr:MULTISPECIES: hypothetical protein [unclassified Pseudomonas]EJM22334.1 hypothetical protein PMI22_01676 [Pseudomonas sp. GM21]MDN4546952.1 hypothetical protein [Pseudomonas sp. C32]MDR6927871.1 hypothetical protein [Pseudomonas sp. BE134]